MTIVRNIFGATLLATIFFFASTAHLFSQTVIHNEGATVSASVAALPTVDGGGTISGSAARAGVRFSGQAYPGATVTLLRTGVQVASVVADIKGSFNIIYTDIDAADRLFFSLVATDTTGRRSTLINFPVTFYTAVLTDIAGIRFAPTITTDKVAVKQGDYLWVVGAALPGQPIEAVIEGPSKKLFTGAANSEGFYRITAPLTLFPGEYLVRARYEGDSRTSTALRLIIGGASVPRAELTANIPGDCNVDQRVTLTDFSVLAYWFGKDNPPRCVDANNDGVINLVDFSILAYYWQG